MLVGLFHSTWHAGIAVAAVLAAPLLILTHPSIRPSTCCDNNTLSLPHKHKHRWQALLLPRPPYPHPHFTNMNAFTFVFAYEHCHICCPLPHCCMEPHCNLYMMRMRKTMWRWWVSISIILTTSQWGCNKDARMQGCTVTLSLILSTHLTKTCLQHSLLMMGCKYVQPTDVFCSFVTLVLVSSIPSDCANVTVSEQYLPQMEGVLCIYWSAITSSSNISFSFPFQSFALIFLSNQVRLTFLCTWQAQWAQLIYSSIQILLDSSLKPWTTMYI